MSRFVNGRTERMDLGDGDWVELRLQLGYGARQAVTAKTLGELAPRVADRREGDPMPVGMLDLEAGNIELLRRAIVAWGGAGFCTRSQHPHDEICEPAAITAEAIAQLNETGDRILKWLEPRLAKPTEDFSRSPSPSISTAGTGDHTTSG